jgi:carbonic anhydrase/acetyltransferase-like protein (isoleucine patch superfamily)
MIHCTTLTHPTVVGDDVTVGHHVVLHGCTLGNRVLVGMGAVVMDGAEVGDESIIGAGALVTPGTKIPPGSLAVGAPARVKRPLTAEERAFLLESAKHYVHTAAEHRASR